MDRCVCRTAFGSPVVPELNTSTASVDDQSRSDQKPVSGLPVQASEKFWGVEVDEVGLGKRRQDLGGGSVVDDVRRAREVDRGRDLSRLPRWAERDERASEFQGWVQRDRELRPVRRHDRHARAGFDPSLLEGSGTRVAETVELAIAVLLVVESERDVLGKAIGGALESTVERPGGVVVHRRVRGPCGARHHAFPMVR
jgi:hypothetical protein